MTPVRTSVAAAMLREDGLPDDFNHLLQQDIPVISINANVSRAKPISQPREESMKVANKTRESTPKEPQETTSRPARAKAPAPKPAPKKLRPGSKLEIIFQLLSRPKGCTTKDVLEACDWPAVSMPQQARAMGVKLRTKKEGRATRYWAA